MDGLQSAPAGTNVGAPTNGPADGTSADAAGDCTSADAAVGTSTGTSADAARDLQLLSAKELWEFWVKCVKLKDEIVDRNHKGRQGRRAGGTTWASAGTSGLPERQVQQVKKSPQPYHQENTAA